ncbi:MAG: hypothetical protein MMC33_009211 [Icmadophila ericetorum]|nr:hypothetical protein [Icmadophila ericetorum]
MSSDTLDEGGARILPIPPPLEFPYPTSDDSKRTLHNGGASSGAENRSYFAPMAPTKKTSSEPKTPILLDDAGASHPRPFLSRKKFITERPVPAQRGSLLAVKRRQKGQLQQALSNHPWNSDSDTLTSSSDEDSPRITKKSSRGGTRPSMNAHLDNAKRISGAQGDYSRFSVRNDNFRTRGKVSKRDGRLNISINETAHKGYLAKALGATLQHHLTPTPCADEQGPALSPLREEDAVGSPHLSRAATASTMSTTRSVYDCLPPPKLNIVIMVIGSRGDIQPFLKLGKVLKEDHGHRVRIATHPAFKKFVEQDSGLEFFSVGGDPAEIMAFMVKNPGLVPTVETVKAGDIGRRRDSMFEMFQGFWRACINATDDEKDLANLKMMGDKHPFIADAIIANPPSFAHVHCAERLGIPLHLMFTFPNSPTQQFPHPLTNIRQSNIDPSYTNFMSYPLVEMMIWQGLGDLVNRFRVKTLGLEPVSTLWAPGQLFRQKVSYTYLWSPGLVPKPADWGPEIDIAGYVFLDLASSFKPPETLVEFLEAGETPVYIGFGSIVVDDPDKFTALIFEAVKLAGIRALVSKGWGGLGDEGNTPENIFMLDNTPHDWLFPRVIAVVHHGGAGSTAIGLKCGKPTLIVPFFGDQPFWGAMVAKAGVGSEPIPYKHLTAAKLAEGIKHCLTPEAQENAQKIAKSIEEEGDGAINAVKSFHRSLPLRGEHSMRCSILENRTAVWELKRTNVRVSALAGELLVARKKIKWHDLRLIRHLDWTDFSGPGEPVTGFGGALLDTTAGVVLGIGGMPVRWAKAIRRKERHDKKEKRKASNESRMGHGGEKRPDINNQMNPSDVEENDGKQAHGGQQGVEKDLPDGNLMKGALQPNIEKDKIPNSMEADDEAEDGMSEISQTTYDSEEFAHEMAEGTKAGLGKTGRAVVKAPMDISIAIAQGFHNAPRLYGDSTVRKPRRISGIQSGLRAAGEEFVYGVYDGVSGLVTHPYQGAKKDGAKGFTKGIGKGIGGFVLKDLSAIFGPFGYTLKGIHKELIKGRQPTHFIRMARMIQGDQDLKNLSDADRETTYNTINKAWKTITGVKREFDAMKERGLRGRIAQYRERREWRKHGAFENVKQANRALEARKQGKDFELVFKRQRKELEKANAPRKSTTDGKHKSTEKAAKEKKQAEEHNGALAGDHSGTEVFDKAVAGMANGAEPKPGIKYTQSA